MKSSICKKLISILLSLLVVFSVPVSALAVEYNAVPVIYIGEMSDNPLYNNPNKNNATVAFDINSSDFTGDMTTIVAGVAFSFFTDAKTGASSVVNGVNAVFEGITCAPNGESASSDVGPWIYNEPMSEHTQDAVYNENIKALAGASDIVTDDENMFFFSYDWRLDPISNAEKLRDFVDHVETYAGASKVSFLCVGYGGIIANTYLNKYESHAKSNIESCIFYNCPIQGNAIVGDFMKGRIARVVADEDSLMGVIGTISGEHRGEAFFDFIADDATGLISGIFENLLGEGNVQILFGKLFTLIFTTIFEAEDGHKTLGKAYNNFALNADSTIYAAGLREYLRNMPGLWALVPQKDYMEAVNFLFEDDFMNSGLEKKLTSYLDVQASTTETLRKAQINGINVCVVASYGMQLLPVTISLDDMSDGIESVKYASVGAVTLDNAKDEGHMNYCTNASHNHMSPDKDIHAAFCALPENTWFIKDLPHGNMTNETVADFVVWLLSGSSQRHIRENSSYTQYMQYSEYTKKLAPYITPGSEESVVKYGDVNLDGQITAADARFVLRMSVGLEETTKEIKILADVDGNGSVAAADARLVLRHSVGLINGFPV